MNKRKEFLYISVDIDELDKLESLGIEGDANEQMHRVTIDLSKVNHYKENESVFKGDRIPTTTAITDDDIFHIVISYKEFDKIMKEYDSSIHGGN